MPKMSLLDQLKKTPLICDGAMGTQLMARGLTTGACGELWNLQRPADVQAIHQLYRNAGSDLLTTNSFGAAAAGLGRHGVTDQVQAINTAAAQIARKVAGDSAWVLGDIGPFGGFLEPIGDTTPEQLMEMFVQQASALKAGGADAIIIETMSDPAEIAVAIHAAKSVANWPLIATYAFARSDSGFRTMMGTSVGEAVQAAIDAGADVVGANCGTSLSLDDYALLGTELVAAAGSVPVILQPNAGSPQVVDGKLIYAATPKDMAGHALRLLQAGVKIIGGCCGTTPDHIAAMAKAMSARQGNPPAS